MYLKWNEEDRFQHPCASLEGPAAQVLWELLFGAMTANLERLLQTWFGTELQAESSKPNFAHGAETRVRLCKIYIETLVVSCN